MRSGHTPPPPVPRWQPACLEADELAAYLAGRFDCDDSRPSWCARMCVEGRCNIGSRPRPHIGHPFDPPVEGQLRVFEEVA